MKEYDILDLSHVGKVVDSKWPSGYSCIKITMLARAISTDTPLFQYINIFLRSHIRWTYLYHWKFSLYSLKFLECSYQDMCTCLIPNILKVLFMTYKFPRHMRKIKWLISLMLFLPNPFRTFWIWERSCFLEQFSFFWLFSKN